MPRASFPKRKSCARYALLTNANLAMQMLDEQGLSPYRTFDSISRFAELLTQCRGAAFSPRITRHQLTEHTFATVIEPPCGSNTIILQSGSEVLFIDSGYACYRQEMLKLFRELLPEWDSMTKTIFVTHADLDHCGLLDLFDEVLCSKRSEESLLLEYQDLPMSRELNRLHAPYIRICKTLTDYQPVAPAKVRAIWGVEGTLDRPLQAAGSFQFADLMFEV